MYADSIASRSAMGSGPGGLLAKIALICANAMEHEAIHLVAPTQEKKPTIWISDPPKETVTAKAPVDI